MVQIIRYVWSCVKCSISKLTCFSVVTCTVPDHDHGSEQPSGTLDYQQTYTLTCDAGYTISGEATASTTATATCQESGTFDTTPSCQG